MISYKDETTSASSLLDDRSRFQFPSRYFSGEVIFLLLICSGIRALFSCTYLPYLNWSTKWARSNHHVRSCNS